MPANKHRLGPRRDPAVDRAIAEAAQSELVERGYAGLTMEGVATRAGVSRPALYRRWKSKADLVADVAFVDLQAATPATDLPGIVAEIVDGCIELIGRPEGRMAVPGLIAELQADPTLYPRLATLLDAPIRDRLHTVLDELQPGNAVDADVVVDAIAGAVIVAVCVRRAEDLDGLSHTLTHLIVNGITGGRRESG